MKITKDEKEYIKGYARALQDMMFVLTGENTCDKPYDPVEFDDGVLHSYAFELKDGGRHHPLKLYKDVEEIRKLMLKESVCFVRDKGIKKSVVEKYFTINRPFVCKHCKCNCVKT